MGKPNDAHLTFKFLSRRLGERSEDERKQVGANPKVLAHTLCAFGS